jgi:hypothetical protein
LLSAVSADFRATGSSEWENGTLDHFLDAFAAYAEARVVDAPGQQQERASWRLFAEIVHAATGYQLGAAPGRPAVLADGVVGMHTCRRPRIILVRRRDGVPGSRIDGNPVARAVAGREDLHVSSVD